MDQQTAMHWVRNNIRYFGGSSTNITISGGNAGGVSVGIHMVSPRSWPYFTSAVAHNPFSLILDSPSKVTLQHPAQQPFPESPKHTIALVAMTGSCVQHSSLGEWHIC